MAEQESPVRRRVAFKIIKLGMDTKEVVARFEAERQALAMMDHPNIATVLDGGATASGRPNFVMELVRGVRITDYCDQNNLPTVERLKLFLQVCHAIQHAHQKGIIHRDIKPSNILVSLHDHLPVSKVIDFGIAKAIGERLTDKTLCTRFEHFIGTPAYMSPEQAGVSPAAAGDIDTRSDIYALGVLLYELLTGRTPFDQKQLAQAGLDEVLRRVREEESPKPSTRLGALQGEELTTTAQHRQTEPPKLISLLRGDLDWIVLKCLEKDRSRRYATANGLAADVQRHLDNEPVLAGPPTAAYRVGKVLRKHRTAVSVAAAFVLLLTLATVVSVGLALRADRERTNAMKAKADAQQKAEAEAKAKAEAQNQRKRAEEALAAMQILRAEDFFTADDSTRGVAHLANVLSRDRSNRVAAERLLSALTFRSFCLPMTEPLRHGQMVWSAQFSPEGRRVVTASWDKTARVWDAQTGQALTEPLRHESAVRSAQFSTDGLRVLTASVDQTARVWELPFGSGPAPEWLPELAVLVAGRRLTGGGILEPVRPEEFLKLREQLLGNAETNYYARWAKWFCADRATRAISPLSTISVPEYVQRRLGEDIPESLREAAWLSPTNGLALAGLARHCLAGKTNPLVEAEWLSRRGLELSPDQPACWRVRAQVLEQAGRLTEALEVMNQGSERQPRAPQFWNDKGLLEEKAHQLQEARSSFTRAIELARADTNQASETPALLNRSRILRQLNLPIEAQADRCRAFEIPPRGAQAKPNLVDLSLFYNAGLKWNWHRDMPESNLAALPTGIQNLGGTEFDIRGLVQVTRWGADYPASVTNVPVGQVCQRFHFLHAAVGAGGAPDGTQIGRYVVHYSNGRQQEIPVVIGQDLADWFEQPNEKGKPFVVAWTGTNAKSQIQNTHIRLFKTTWPNPWPDIAIQSIDFEALDKQASPFLVAITVE
jgi:tetratricopeptide (TPR) repeat protein